MVAPAARSRDDSANTELPTGGLPALVIGAGPAGLATSHALQELGIEHRVLERGSRPGAAWAEQYDSLTLHTGKHLSSLPGLPFPAAAPLFVPRDTLVAYYARYVAHFGLPVELGQEVASVVRDAGWFRVATADRELRARALVVATGTMSNPLEPNLPGRESFGGDLIHSSQYRRPEPFAGKRTLVVGCGNSAGEIAAELERAGVAVTLSTRSGANVVPKLLFGVPIQYCALPLAYLPRRVQRLAVAAIGRLGALRRGPSPLPAGVPKDCPDVPLIGLALADGLRAGRIGLRPALAAFGTDTVRFADGSEDRFDAVILATGYRPALEFLGELAARDACGYARRDGRVQSALAPGLVFVGHNNDMRGAIFNIRLDAPRAARAVRDHLASLDSRAA